MDFPIRNDNMFKACFYFVRIASEINMHIFSKALQLSGTKELYILFDSNGSNHKGLYLSHPIVEVRGVEHSLCIHLQFFEHKIFY